MAGWREKTWNGTKQLLRIMSNADHLEGDSVSRFDHAIANTHQYQLRTEKQYANAKELDASADKALATMRIPANLNCFDSLALYADKRQHALDEVFDKKVPGFKTAPKLDNTRLATEIKTFEALKAQIRDEITGADIGLSAIKNKLHTTTSDAVKMLIKQFEEDKKSIEAHPDYERSEKQKLIGALKENHEAALEEFKATMNAQINIQHNLVRTEYPRLAFIMHNINHDRETKSKLEKTVGIDPDLTKIVLSGTGGDEEKLKNANFTGIKFFTTPAGSKIEQKVAGTFEMNIPGRFWGVRYHNDLQDNLLADLTLLALAVKASGRTKITITLSGNNEAEMKLIARKSIIASMEAGFKIGNGKDEDAVDENGNKYTKEARMGNITIMINGNVMPLLPVKDKEGRVTQPGLFNSQEELTRYVNKGKAIEDEMNTIESRDKWVEKGSTVTLGAKAVGDSVELVVGDAKPVVVDEDTVVDAFPKDLRPVDHPEDFESMVSGGIAQQHQIKAVITTRKAVITTRTEAADNNTAKADTTANTADTPRM